MWYVVYGQWDHGQPISSSVLSRINATFLPRYESVCVWAEPGSPCLLRVSVDVSANDGQDAIAQGRVLLEDAARSGSLSGQPAEVVAITEEHMSSWKAQPGRIRPPH